jgi:hypothetical protein
MNFQCIKEVIKRDESTTRNFSTNEVNLALFYLELPSLIDGIPLSAKENKKKKKKKKKKPTYWSLSKIRFEDGLSRR